LSLRNTLGTIGLWIGLATAVGAQAPGASDSARPAVGKVLGDVTALDASVPSLILRTEDGRAVTVKTGSATQYLKAKPGAKTLEDAQAVTLAEIAVGDRVLATGALSADGAALTARRVIVMSHGDIADKHQRDQAEWRTRGVGGVISALDPAKQEVTLQIRSLAGTQTVVVSTAEKKAAFKRYAPDSVKFSDTKPGTFADLEVGDQVRALGDRSEDGARLAAEQVVSGAFRTVVAQVQGIDAAKGEIRIVDGATSHKLTVTVTSDAVLRRLPAEFAARMAGGGMRRGPASEGGEGGAAPASAPARTEGAAPQGGEGRPRWGGGPGGGGGRGGPPNLGDLLERMPALTLAELKAGDRIAISSTRGADATRLTAVALVAGIEPLLAVADAGSRRQGVELMPGLPSGALDMGMGGGF
jgi:hypothetical protein